MYRMHLSPIIMLEKVNPALFFWRNFITYLGVTTRMFVESLRNFGVVIPPRSASFAFAHRFREVAVQVTQGSFFLQGRGKEDN